MRLRRNSAVNRKASSENRKVFSEESEGFFRRALGSYTHKFPKRGAASLTYLPRSRLDLPRSRLGLPHLRLSRNSGPATEGFSNRGINFKDAYRKYVQGKLLFGSKRQPVLCQHYQCQYCSKQEGNPRQPAFKANALCQLSYQSNTDG